jgi:tight adherence protein B
MDFAVGAVFVLAFGVVLGGYWLFVVRPEAREERALRKRLQTQRRSVLATALTKAREQLSAVALLDRTLARSRSLVEPVRKLIISSGVRVTIGTVLLGCIFLGLVTAVAIFHFSRSIILALAVAAVVAWLPIGFLRYKADKRLAVFEEQFPEAMDLIARALRAGHALTATFQVVGEEVPDPAGAEFRQLFEQQNYGLSLPDALKAFARRSPILDARFFVTALLTQRETGGNLSEVLDNLAVVIRERFKVKRQVRVMSAHGRITGWVLACLPIAVGMILFAISPNQMRVLVDDPLGVDMVVAALILEVVGVLAIRKIVNIEY